MCISLINLPEQIQKKIVFYRIPFFVGVGLPGSGEEVFFLSIDYQGKILNYEELTHPLY